MAASKLLTAGGVLAAAWAYSYVVYPEFTAWTAFSLAVATGNWDPCFFSNPFVSSLFMEVHRKRLGPNPKNVDATPVRELAKEDYSYEALRVASDNWKEPVIVRGLFSDVPAVKEWKLKGGLASLAEFNVSVVQNSTMGKDHWINCGGHPGVDSVYERFGSALEDVAGYNPNSTDVAKTLVIPPASRSDRLPDPHLDKALMKMVEEGLDLQRVGGSWGKKGLATATLLQLWIGAGDVSRTQGTGVHCDICNNFIVQLEGAKEWLFMHPKYSALLRPTMRRGKTAISGVDMSARSDVVPYIERLHAVVKPGDFIYNPDWYWHSVNNLPGRAMAVVARECNVTNFLSANPIFTGLILTNHVAASASGKDSYARTRLINGVFGKSLQGK